MSCELRWTCVLRSETYRGNASAPRLGLVGLALSMRRACQTPVFSWNQNHHGPTLSKRDQQKRQAVALWSSPQRRSRVRGQLPRPSGSRSQRPTLPTSPLFRACWARLLQLLRRCLEGGVDHSGLCVLQGLETLVLKLGLRLRDLRRDRPGVIEQLAPRSLEELVEYLQLGLGQVVLRDRRVGLANHASRPRRLHAHEGLLAVGPLVDDLGGRVPVCRAVHLVLHAGCARPAERPRCELVRTPYKLPPRRARPPRRFRGGAA